MQYYAAISYKYLEAEAFPTDRLTDTFIKT